MQTKEEMIYALQNPQKAPFRVTFEIFPSSDRRRIAKWPKELAWTMERPIEGFWWYGESEIIAVARKTKSIERIKKEYQTQSERLSAKLETDTARYRSFKVYLKQKIKCLGLTNPLIFFDEKSLRIDIGYGPKESSVFFPGFFPDDGTFNEFSIMPGVVSEAEDYYDFLNVEIEGILSIASAEFVKPLTPKKKVSIGQTREFNEAEFIKKCFETNAGLIVGEVHAHKSSKQFLVDNMFLFKSQGVTTIYMEHLLAERHQSLLDEYLDLDPAIAMPRELKLYLNHLDKERHLSGSATFTAIVQSAKQHQIRIIAIDSEATYSLAGYSLGEPGNTQIKKERYSAMNMAMLLRYREFNDGGKYIAFIGSGHVSTCLGVPGVSELLSCPNIVVSDLNKSMKEHIEQDILFGEDPEIVHFDMLYHRDQPSSCDDNHEESLCYCNLLQLFSHSCIKWIAALLMLVGIAGLIYGGVGLLALPALTVLLISHTATTATGAGVFFFGAILHCINSFTTNIIQTNEPANLPLSLAIC